MANYVLVKDRDQELLLIPSFWVDAARTLLQPDLSFRGESTSPNGDYNSSLQSVGGSRELLVPVFSHTGAISFYTFSVRDLVVMADSRICDVEHLSQFTLVEFLHEAVIYNSFMDRRVSLIGKYLSPRAILQSCPVKLFASLIPELVFEDEGDDDDVFPSWFCSGLPHGYMGESVAHYALEMSLAQNCALLNRSVEVSPISREFLSN